MALRPKVTGSKDRDAGQRPDARQHADQRADQAADEGVPEIAGLEGDAEAVRQTEKGVFHLRVRLYFLRMILSENRFPLFGIMPYQWPRMPVGRGDRSR